MVSLSETLDQVNETLTQVSSYLTAVVALFDGTVNITSEKPPVLANYTSIRSWADRILMDVKSYNRTSYQDYQDILLRYEEVSLNRGLNTYIHTFIGAYIKHIQTDRQTLHRIW